METANKIFKIIYLLLAVLFIISYFQIRKLPLKTDIALDLLKEPVQTESSHADFSFAYRGEEYQVKPLADYELYGLVVSVNNIGAWYNYYHDENTVNLKDVCVVWGANIENEVYRDPEIKFNSGEWTCYYQWSGRLKKKFYPDKLSNNHLLAADEKIQKKIRDVHVGDQLYLKGALVDYAEAGTAWYRKTSLSREDSNQNSRSGGACEVLYVDELTLIAKNQAFWQLINFWSPRILLILLAVNFLIIIRSAFRLKKKLQ